MIYFLVPRALDFGILEYVEMWGSGLEGLFSVIHYEDLPNRVSLPSGTYVFSSLDQLAPEGFRLVRAVEGQLRSARPANRVLNSTATALRHDLLATLWREGLNRHRAVRATDGLGELRFPVFLREEHQHTGALSPLLRTPEELRAELARTIVKGYRLDELLVVEFCDTMDADGRYRKYSTLIIGSEIIPQFMVIGSGWELKQGNTDFSREMLLEERAYVEQNPHADQLRRIFALAKAEYGGIDYAIKDGVIETWEINLNPTLGRYPTLPPELHRIRQTATESVYERFRAAFRALDRAAPAGPPIAIGSGPARAPGRWGMIRRGPRTRFPARIVRAARPIRPLIEGAIRTLSSVVVWVARRGR